MTQTAQHTPGPWNANGKSVKAISHGSYFTVARVEAKKFTPDGYAANARLIAAAPDILEALELCVDCLADLARLDDGTPSISALGIARAAIAKARG